MESENINDNVTEQFHKLDICGWSVFHYLFTRPPIQTGTFLSTYLIPWFITAFLLYGIPLIIAWVKVPNVLFSDPDSGLTVGFLADWNMMFVFLVTVPMFVIFMLSERAIYRGKNISDFVSLWNKRYKIVNVFGQLGGLLAAFGLNLLVLLVVNIKRGDIRTIPLLVMASVLYIIFCPVIFIGPLLAFRKIMLLAKQAEQQKVATKLQQEYTRIMNDLDNRLIAKEDEEIIDRLQKLKELVNRIPVWPFDISTMRRFVTVYIFPLLTGLISLLVSYIITALKAMYAN